MYNMTRGMVTLLGAAVAGLLVWFATQVNDTTTGGYWAVYGLIAGAGLVMALSQLLGGWTKGRMPRLAINVFLFAFIPTLIAAGWVVVAHQPHPNWFRNHITSWSSDISILNVVRDLAEYVSVLAFGIGLVFGYSFDTVPPDERAGFGRRRRGAAVPAGAGAARTTDDDATAPTAREQAEASEDGDGATSRPRFGRRRREEPVER
ncbi:MAG TPA: hypothetical protein VIW19_13885 [Gaiellaceae bacterium]